VIAVLQKATRVQTEDFITVAEEFQQKSSRPVLAKNLLDFARAKK